MDVLHKKKRKTTNELPEKILLEIREKIYLHREWQQFRNPAIK